MKHETHWDYPHLGLASITLKSCLMNLTSWWIILTSSKKDGGPFWVRTAHGRDEPVAGDSKDLFLQLSNWLTDHPVILSGTHPVRLSLNEAFFFTIYIIFFAASVQNREVVFGDPATPRKKGMVPKEGTLKSLIFTYFPSIRCFRFGSCLKMPIDFPEILHVYLYSYIFV